MPQGDQSCLLLYAGGVQNTTHFIADFGVSKVVTQGTVTTHTTHSGSVGTPGFQPKEQLKTEAVDVYALGCVFIELFGERKVWEGLTAYQIMFKVTVEGAKPDFSHLPESVKPICAKCLDKQENRVPACVSLNSVKTFYNRHFIWIVLYYIRCFQYQLMYCSIVATI